MSIKMAELTKLSNTSKSTILYYLKEGLLPEPKKPKPNVHLYDDDSVATIEFIKYLQEHLNYSITEIKSIIDDNNIDFKNDSNTIINYLTAINDKSKERDIKNILKRAKELGVSDEFFETYKKVAIELASLEYKMGAKLLTENQNNEKNELHKLIFDIILTYKPYVFNQATLKEHKVRVYETAKGQR